MATNQNQQQNTRPSSSRFSPPPKNNNNNAPLRRLSPFGRANLEWSLVPLEGEAVRISLEGLGDPFHRILGKPLNKNYGKVENVIEALQNEQELHDELALALNENWAKYEFLGAAMLYPWGNDIKRAFNDFIYPLPPQPETKNDDDNDDEFTDDNDDNSSPQPTGPKVDVSCLRAIDAAFVLNVLARARSNVVVASTPLALESGFLSLSYICDDPRIVSIARVTGYIEEIWSR